MFDPAVADCGSQGTASSTSSAPEQKALLRSHGPGASSSSIEWPRGKLVEMSGLEPPASALRRQRSPN